MRSVWCQEDAKPHEIVTGQRSQGQAVVTGSGFCFGLFAHRMKAVFPEGASGQVTVHGRFWKQTVARPDAIVDVATEVDPEETADAAADGIEAAA